MALIRSLKGEHYGYKCALESIISASCWPAERVAQIHPLFSPACPRCGHASETSLHCFWECPANDSLPDEEVQSTQNLRETAKVKALEHPCLWLRGILPQTLVTIESQYLPKEHISVEYANKSKVQWISGVYYGDASGGEFTSYRPLRRCGCGVAVIDAQGDLLFGANFTLPGEVQTVPRAELFALVFLTRNMCALAEVEYITDNLGLYNTYHGGPVAGCARSNCDLYHELFKLTKDKAIRLRVRWMPSHLDHSWDLPVGVSHTDVKGNEQADILAGNAAKRACVPLHVSASYLHHVSIVRKI